MNQIPGAIGFRAAVDVPSGVGEKTGGLAFIADFTYATGFAKTPLFDAANAKWVGRIRFIDLGFLENSREFDAILTRPTYEFIYLQNALQWLGRLRDPASDKRAFGRVLIISGSRSYPGAQMLNVLGALRAGAGLVTALTPASHAAAFAAARPEAMWRACPEEPDGSHGAATLEIARELWPRCTAVLAGSGLGKGEASQKLMMDLARECPLPLVLDADALTPKVFNVVAQRPEGFRRGILRRTAASMRDLRAKAGTCVNFAANTKSSRCSKPRLRASVTAK